MCICSNFAVSFDRVRCNKNAVISITLRLMGRLSSQFDPPRPQTSGECDKRAIILRSQGGPRCDWAPLGAASSRSLGSIATQFYWQQHSFSSQPALWLSPSHFQKVRMGLEG